jgi:hypothetical protein
MIKPIGKVITASSNVICGTAVFLEDIVDILQDEGEELGQSRRFDHIEDRRERAASLIGGKFTKVESDYVTTPRRFRK